MVKKLVKTLIGAPPKQQYFYQKIFIILTTLELSYFETISIPAHQEV